MSRDILDDIISDFNPEKFIKFFRSKNTFFSPRQEELTQYNDDNFKNGKKLGEINFKDNSLIIYYFQAEQELSEKSGKKAQYEKSKKILKETQTDTGIFIYYDQKDNFRFSLIYANYLGRRRDWSTFRRFTYFVSKEFTNKTFLLRIGDGDFSDLEKIKDAFSVEKVTKEFYEDIANWYFWAVQHSTFPKDAEEDNGRNIAIIRLITRLIFIWFMKERGLVQGVLFEQSQVAQLLKDLSAEKTTYYKAILQNLFFSTLNTKIENRKYRFQKSFQGRNKDYMDHSIYRYESYFKDNETMLSVFKDIPYLNGGLFDCLDKPSKDNENQGEVRIDGFTDKDVGLNIPNFLFFTDLADADLNKDYGTKNKKYKVRGVINILSSYNFTIDENDPNDQEIALDPELLGKVFENLLASFNPETASTARKATGSYYTPREIVDYMVTQSLENYLKTNLEGVDELDSKLGKLLLNKDDINPFDYQETLIIVNLINDLRIVDPAVGSGAFPMGILNKLVFILSKLDPDNTLWKATQLKAVEDNITDPVLRKKLLDQIEEQFTYKNFDYGRKLYLIQKCIYGVDIQQIAVEIAKLRFFISLLVDEKIDKSKENWGIEPLPNLDYKIMQGNSLVEEYEGVKLFDERLLNVELPSKEEIDEVKQKIKYIQKDLLPYYQKNPQWDKNPKLERPSELTILESEHNRLKSIQKDLEKLNRSGIKINNQQLLLQSDEIKSQKVWVELQKLHKQIFTPSLSKDEKNNIRELVDELEWKLIEETLREQNKIKELEKIKKLENSNTKPFFLWKLYFPEVFEEKGGFDVVIANPPYIRQEEISNKDELKKEYRIFNSVADLYTYFYERGLKLLRKGGVLTFITSSKFTRARYGFNLRKYLKEKMCIKSIVNFGDKHIFEAVTNTLIFIAINEATESNTFNYSDEIEAPDKVVFPQGDLQDSEWTIDNPEIISLKKKIENEGTPLKDWNIQMFRGLLTGYNEAYIIDTPTKDKLCKQDKQNLALIKPIIRGRNIRDYSHNWNGEWIIFIPWHFPLQNDSSITKASKEAEKIFARTYPSIFEHLSQFKENLTKRNQSETGIRYEWYAMQRYAADYIDHFKKEKIIWIELTDKNRFSYSESEEYVLAGAFMMTGESLKFLLAFLNSKLCLFYFSLICNSSGMATIQWKKFALEKVPIKKLSADDQKPFIKVVDKILAITKDEDYLQNSAKQDEVHGYENQIDQLVYKLYGFKPEEIAIVEGKNEKS